MASFEKALSYILGSEGGFSNRKADKGGPTNFGITQKTLDLYRADWDATYPLDVKWLTQEQAGVIYYDLYWKFSEIQNDRVATKLMDIYINMPPTKAIKIAQMSANQINPDGALVVDGHLGPKTVASINACDPDLYLGDLVSELSAYYLSLNQPENIKGWLNRAARLPQ